MAAARALFSGSGDSENMPSTVLPSSAFQGGGIGIIDLLSLTGLVPSRGEARRLIEQGGVAVDDEKVTDIAYIVSAENFEKGHVSINKGKKVFHKAIKE